MTHRCPEPRSHELQAAYAFCRDVAKREAKNFFYAFKVLPTAKSDAMCAIYAFMRKADDLADDESLSLEERRADMATWTGQWRASREREPDDPVFLAVRDTQARFGIDDSLLEQLVAGTTLDLSPAPAGVTWLSAAKPGAAPVQIYESMEALRRYCYLVASVVGLVCIRIFGYSDPKAEELAISTGIAFQLTNILRDLREDAKRGRLYLSADVLQSHGVTPAEMLAAIEGGGMNSAELEVLRSFVREAQGLYRSANQLIPFLDADSRAAMCVLAGIYHRLLDRIGEDPAAVLHTRVRVSLGEKLAILAQGGVTALEAHLPA